MKYNTVYDPAALVKNLLLTLLMMGCMYFTKGSGFAVFVLLIMSALVQNKTEKILVYMMITIVALTGNGALMPKDTWFSIMHKSMMLIMSIIMIAKLAGVRHSRLVTPLMGMFFYVIYMAAISFQGWNPLISSLKLILFASCYFAFYGFANTIIRDQRISTRNVRSAYLALAFFLLVGSLVLIPFPAISQLRADQYLEAVQKGVQIRSLFCGMVFHSQALGPLVAILFVLLLSDLIFCVHMPDKLMIFLLACCPYLLYMTSSRTAMGSILAGGFFAMFLFMRARNVGSRWRGKVISIFLLLLVVGSAALLATSGGRKSVAKYVLKDESAVTLQGATMEKVVSTRQGLMDSAMDNFRRKPLFGNGFQVSEQLIGFGSNGLKEILSAPVEKGVWTTAVLEEGGAIGMFIFCCFALSALFALVRRKAHITASLFVTILVLNLGEFTMFSMSGIGGFYWCMCFVGPILDEHRLRMITVQTRGC